MWDDLLAWGFILGIPLLLAAVAGAVQYFLLTRLRPKVLRRLAALAIPAVSALLTGVMYYKSQTASGYFLAGLTEFFLAMWSAAALLGALVGAGVALWRRRKKKTKEGPHEQTDQAL